MRVLAAVVLVTLASAAGAQAAMFPAPAPLRGLPLIQFERAAKAHGGQLSCTADTHAKIGKSQHRLLPVACEQPPRTKVLDTPITMLLAP